jgi:hypothetical protein
VILFVIAGLDPAIHLLANKMDPRVKPAGDDRMPQRLRRVERFVCAALRAAAERALFEGLPTGRDGTRLPSRRASESPMAIACLRLFTFPPLPPFPLRSVPRLNLCISRSTSFDALGEYFLAMAKSSLNLITCRAD